MKRCCATLACREQIVNPSHSLKMLSTHVTYSSTLFTRCRNQFGSWLCNKQKQLNKSIGAQIFIFKEQITFSYIVYFWSRHFFFIFRQTSSHEGRRAHKDAQSSVNSPITDVSICSSQQLLIPFSPIGGPDLIGSQRLRSWNKWTGSGLCLLMRELHIQRISKQGLSDLRLSFIYI